MSTFGLLLFEHCDAMDVVGPYEVLLTAGRLQERDGVDVTFDVRTLSVDGGPVTAYGGMGLVPSHGRLADNDLDVIVVPGLIALDTALADDDLLAAIAAASKDTDVTVSVCTGSFLLDAAGVLGDVPATTHWEDVALLADRRADGVVTRGDVRWVDAGDVVTSGGIASGIAMALHLVERFADRELAVRCARQIDHVWKESRE